MDYLEHLVKSKGTANLFSRLIMIIRRFGFTSKKSKKALETFVSIASKHKCVPSLFVTGDLLNHNRSYFQALSSNGVSIGLHGYHHVDHTLLSKSTQYAQIRHALHKFACSNIKIRGFRSPYLRFNSGTVDAALRNGLNWTSNVVMYFYPEPYVKECDMHCANRLVESFYTPKSIRDLPSLPFYFDGALEIPVSLPDDELLIDRFKITNTRQLADVWLWMLDFTRKNGELLNLIFHPERLSFYKEALDIVLGRARKYNDVWITSINDIATWWENRSSFTVETEKRGLNHFQITPTCNGQAALFLQYPGGKCECVNDTHTICSVETDYDPVIEIPHGYEGPIVKWLKNEGFLLKVDVDPNACAFSLNEATSATTARQATSFTHQSKGPLLRYGRWPRGYTSALAITTDVDAMSLLDFFRRASHFCRTRKHTRQGSPQ